MFVGWNKSSYMIQSQWKGMASSSGSSSSSSVSGSTSGKNNRWFNISRYVLPTHTPITLPVTVAITSQAPVVALWGKCVSHSVIHGVLFGTYVVTKRYFSELSDKYLDYSSLSDNNTTTPVNITITRTTTISTNPITNLIHSMIIYTNTYINTHYNIIKNGMIVSIAGGLAGAMSEYVTVVCSSMQLETRTLFPLHSKSNIPISTTPIFTPNTPNTPNTNVNKPPKLWKLSHFVVPMRKIFGLSVLFPSVLGFLAFEYGHLLLHP